MLKTFEDLLKENQKRPFTMQQCSVFIRRSARYFYTVGSETVVTRPDSYSTYNATSTTNPTPAAND